MTDDARLIEWPDGRRFLVVPGTRGIGAVTSEVDETNVASNTLMKGLGATRTGGAIELVRRVQPVG